MASKLVMAVREADSSGWSRLYRQDMSGISSSDEFEVASQSRKCGSVCWQYENLGLNFQMSFGLSALENFDVSLDLITLRTRDIKLLYIGC